MTINTETLGLRLSGHYIFGIGIGVALGGAYVYGDDLLFETAEEHAIEQELGQEVSLRWSDRGEERSRKVAQFYENYTRARQNWDYFDQQFGLVHLLFIETDYEAAGEAVTSLRLLRMNSHEGEYTVENDSILVHELAHFWHAALPQQKGFDRKWEKIAGTEYHGCSSSFDTQCFKKYRGRSCRERTCDDFILAVAASTCYGAKDIKEHVAEIVKFVYDASYPHHYLLDPSVPFFESREEQCEKIGCRGAPLLPKTIPKLKELITLAADYAFFSPRERDHALKELEWYQGYYRSRGDRKQ